MSLSAVLDIVIGLSFTYFLLALFCSWANELVAHQLNRRGKFLFKGLREMLQNGGTLENFVTHPLIESLDRVRSGAPRPPITQEHDYKARKEIFPSYLPASTVATVLLDVVSPQGGANRFVDVRRQIDQIPNDKLKRALQTIADRADNDIEALRKGVEDWYANTMDRVSGWYKTRAQAWLIFFGFLFAVLFNVDTFRVVRELWTNPTARAVTVQAAAGVVQGTDADDIRKQMKAIEAAKDSEQRLALIEKLNKQVNVSGHLGTSLGTAERATLPVGWSATQQAVMANCVPLLTDDPCKIEAGLFEILVKAFGLFVTACAVAFGAPFWFELMNKLVDIRSSGRKPEDPEKK